MEVKPQDQSKPKKYEWLKVTSLAPTIAALMGLSKALWDLIPKEYLEKSLSPLHHQSASSYGILAGGILAGLLLWNGKTIWHWLKAFWKPVLFFSISAPLLLFHWAIPFYWWVKYPISYLLIFGSSVYLFRRGLKAPSEEVRGADDSLRDPAEDLLGRAQFCENLFEMIQSLSSAPARIAITGEWGSGKTTCLNFVRDYANRAKYPTAFFDSWQYKDTEEAKAGFIKSIDAGIAEWRGIKIGPFKRKTILHKLISVVGKSSRAAINIASVGTLFDELFQSRLTGSLSVTKDYVSDVLSDQLQDKPLIVFIDDLDRSRDHIVFDFFLFIKEIIDVRNCVFICGFDKDAVSNIFEKSSPVKDIDLFLDKIFQHIYPLPEPTQNDREKLLEQQITAYKDRLDSNFLQKYKQLWPNNPRQMKSYFRHLSNLRNFFLKKFSDEDLNWERVYLAELLKLEFPKIATSLINDQEFIEWLSVSKFFMNIDEGIAKSHESWKEKLAVPELASKQQRIEMIAESMAAANTLRFGSKEQISYELRVLSHPEVLTWKQYREWYQEFKGWKNEPKPELKKIGTWQKLIDKKEPLEARREFLKTLMRERDGTLEKAMGGQMQSEIETYRTKTIELTKDGFAIVEMNDLFADQELIFDADTVKEWLSLLRKRIGHNRPDQIEFRKLEEQLILELAQKAKGQAEVLFEKVLLTQEMLGPPNEELDQINKKIAKIWRKELAAQILNKFTQLGGLDTYNDPNKHHEEKRLLFSPESEFDQDGLAKLADRAFSDEGIQANFLQILKLFFRSVSNDNYNHLQVTIDVKKKIFCE